MRCLGLGWPIVGSSSVFLSKLKFSCASLITRGPGFSTDLGFSTGASCCYLAGACISSSSCASCNRRGPIFAIFHAAASSRLASILFRDSRFHLTLIFSCNLFTGTTSTFIATCYMSSTTVYSFPCTLHIALWYQ